MRDRDGEDIGGDFGGDFDWATAGAAMPFPTEQEWLTLPAPPIAADFVARTLAAVAADLEQTRPRQESEDVEPELSPAQLATFGPDAPSPDFVDRTLRRLLDDRRDRWHELLARYVAPEPSPAFVQRTLAALAEVGPVMPRQEVHGQAAHRRRTATPNWQRRSLATLPWLAAAAGVIWFVWLRQPDATPFERRVANRVAAEFRHADSPSPLPALLAQLAHDEAPLALSTGLADGYWLAAAGQEGR